MEYAALFIAVALCAYLLWSGNKNRLVAATERDWFVVFDADAEKKVLRLWFYPVIGFRSIDDHTVAVTSRPSYTQKLASIRLPKTVSEDVEGVSFESVSVSYGQWFRDGVPFDEKGNPDLQQRADFSHRVEGYLLGDFQLDYATPVPLFYQGQLRDAFERSKRPQ